MPADVAITGEPVLARAGRGMRFLDGKRLPALIVGLALCVLVLPPLWFLIEGAVTVDQPDGTTRWTLERFSQIVNQRGFAASAMNSAIFSIGSALLALVMGGITAWLVERTNTPWKPLAYFTTIISMGTPYVLDVSAWLLQLAKSGPIKTWWRQ